MTYETELDLIELGVASQETEGPPGADDEVGFPLQIS